MSRLSSYERYDTSNTDTTEYKVSDFNDVNNIVYNSLHIDNLLMIKKQDVSVQRYSDDIISFYFFCIIDLILRHHYLFYLLYF